MYGWICQLSYVFFFFQAEDGIRDLTVTGVQTCALPILDRRVAAQGHHARAGPADVPEQELQQRAAADHLHTVGMLRPGHRVREGAGARSEERRVGKECRSRWSPYH